MRLFFQWILVAFSWLKNLPRNLRYLALALAGALLIFGCTQMMKKGDSVVQTIQQEPARSPSNDKLLAALEVDAARSKGKIEYVKPMSEKERFQLWHLSEGADVFPLLWYLKMKSQISILAEKSTLGEKLFEKFGLIPVKNASIGVDLSRSPFPMDYVGLTLAWSDSDPITSDVKGSYGQNLEEFMRVKTNAQSPSGKSIAFVGTNCTFCHSNLMKVGDKYTYIEGAPSMMNPRGFFQDMFGSTTKHMLDPKLLTQFLSSVRETPVKEGSDEWKSLEKQAQDFTTQFMEELGLKSLAKEIQALIASRLLKRGIWSEEKVRDKRLDAVKNALYKHRKDVVPKYLQKLLVLTYNLNDTTDLTPELRARMQFLATSIGGSKYRPGDDPDPKRDSPEGYSRVDAFGRIANLVARGDDPILITGITSIPQMWNIQYSAFFHWNGNTNSIISRNIGQSFGLGAVLKDPVKNVATTNIHNLYKLERALYKVSSPAWKDVDPDLKHLDLNSALRGCVDYHKTCAQCHSSTGRIGPTNSLIDYPIFSSSGKNSVGTDEQYLKNQSTPVGSTPFRQALFGFTKGVKETYYNQYKDLVDPDTGEKLDPKKWERVDIRDTEYFRDTYLAKWSLGPTLAGFQTMTIPYYGANIALSEQAHIQYSRGSYSSARPGYIARNLAGIWATAPYLHNGSVPSIADLLKPAKDRPKRFFLSGRKLNVDTLGYETTMEDLEPYMVLITEADRKNRGIRIEQIKKAHKAKTGEELSNAEAGKAWLCEELPAFCVEVDYAGNSNMGHEGESFGTTWSGVEGDQRRRDLIEFLKILRPEVEYSRKDVEPYYVWNESRQTCDPVK